jgi:hypothetical protein
MVLGKAIKEYFMPLVCQVFAGWEASKHIPKPLAVFNGSSLHHQQRFYLECGKSIY